MHNNFIENAIKCARDTAKNGGMPFGAIIVKDGIVFGKSNIPCADFDPTAHAEITAIRDACANLKTHDLSRCVIYLSCRPGQMCAGAIKRAGIKTIYFAMDKDDAKSIGYLNDIFYDDTIVSNACRTKDGVLNDFMKG